MGEAEECAEGEVEECAVAASRVAAVRRSVRPGLLQAWALGRVVAAGLRVREGRRWGLVRAAPWVGRREWRAGRVAGKSEGRAQGLLRAGPALVVEDARAPCQAARDRAVGQAFRAGASPTGLGLTVAQVSGKAEALRIVRG